MEGALQTKIIQFLRSKGAYVIKPRAAPGVPVGCPDIIFLFEGAWGVIECKASASAKWQPGQEATLKRLQSWTPFAWKVYPENWPEIKSILLTQFF